MLPARTSQRSGFQESATPEALSLIQEVRQRFVDEREVYDQIINALQAFKNGRCGCFQGRLARAGSHPRLLRDRNGRKGGRESLLLSLVERATWSPQIVVGVLLGFLCCSGVRWDSRPRPRGDNRRSTLARRPTAVVGIVDRLGASSLTARVLW